MNLTWERRRLAGVVMRDEPNVETFHEPTVWCPGFSRSGPPEGGTPNKWRPTERFMVPMHGIKVVGAFHEPQGAAGILPAQWSEKSSAGKMPAAPWPCLLTRWRFMVPMHAEKTKGGSP